jgi:hypothetical protein
MTTQSYIQLAIVLGFFFIAWAAFKYIKYLKGRKNNTELWGTIFEGVTHKMIDLDAIKKPEVFIEKRARKSGQDYEDENDRK